ncbi:hypothetical protein QE152_g38818 [Popillia japonica]|uniref:Uncharacterized protein n=1 Tax=Popillia japonica TaxID=7064 RepID=A0AAW1HVT7_POPJA
MQFILEHSIPRQGQDSRLQLSVTDQENMEQDSQEMQESEVEFEPEVMNSREIMSPSSGHYQLSEDENDERYSGMNPAKKIKIQSVHIINESDVQTDSSYTPTVSNSSYTPTETPKARANRKTKAKTTNSEDTEFMKTALVVQH